ncbi:MAG TPA: phosphatidylserine decarboxylase [Candidatus Saccharicenans sp.]|jgi:phosphatidylserine decarboxylase|nr:phosphatidylserine decarboxylase family protein [Candidatus Saccharicenans sp.]HRD01685.1 phosphatidylserine decarboxylase [Candidatus Saccharicenans sp.]
MKVAREGLVFWLPALILAAGLLIPGWWVGSLLFFLLAAAFAFFFRDPARRPPAGPDLVLSPADGQVLKIESFTNQPEVVGPGQKISIFLSLLDVHFTRSPLAAEIVKVDYNPGKFFPAYRDEASSQNESNSLVLATEAGQIFLKQMVGVAARRIKCYVKPGDRVQAGQKIGLMYFGSRVDLFLPASIKLKISPGQKVKGGLTIIGEIKNEGKD